MFQALTTSMKATLYERTSSPIFSSFIISWLICNFRIVILFFSSLEPRYKIYEIELVISKDILNIPFLESFHIPYFHLFFIPLAISLFYTLLLPFIEARLYKVWLKGQRELINAKSESEGKTTWSQAQIDTLRQELQTNKYESLTLLEKNDSEIRRLKGDLESQRIAEEKNTNQALEIETDRYTAIVEGKNKDINDMKNDYVALSLEFDEAKHTIDVLLDELKEFKEKSARLDNLEVRVLTDFINSNGYMLSTYDYIGRFNGPQKLQIENMLVSLQESRYIAVKEDSYSNDILVLTNLGKRYYEDLMA
ncbi:hypothetical protein G3485_17345 [Shewanella baltica]|uniref:ATG16 family protein n=1 Tax=Shewanella baltica TaxID=62322 RepID=UPI00217DD1CA|nr:ATG16 family protein [Shewanella baltica]MCS6128885.1 hypothetical protein [Shewanella baltica]MCS6140815.1 hypothetical protein [Shewanella baltica]MCS6147099.1 hypothetical protein [Shewanella baltica]MCS6171628.1 hypothetical protein [Shewanella baltica]MCS6188853.1 hypothetical protein [Shewanella baltica]